MLRIYTRGGDDGTTALRVGGRVRKDSLLIEANGAVDEAQAAIGFARSLAGGSSDLQGVLVAVERDLWILMAEIATSPDRGDRLEPGRTKVTEAMVAALESEIDRATEGLELDPAFAVPGEEPVSAALDVARTVVRRAERLAVALELPDGLVVAYLNRCSDLLWALARATEQVHRVNRRTRTR